MPYVPRSPPGIALSQVRRMVALSAAFQAGIGAAGEPAALQFVTVGRKSMPGPGASVYLDADTPLSWELYAGGEQNWLKPRGVVAVLLMFPVDSGDDVETRYLKGVDQASNTASDLAALANRDDPQHQFEMNHLGAIRIDTGFMSLGEPQHDHSRGLLFVAKLRVEWGDGT